LKQKWPISKDQIAQKNINFGLVIQSIKFKYKCNRMIFYPKCINEKEKKNDCRAAGHT
jgi:hypothetical protein